MDKPMSAAVFVREFLCFCACVFFVGITGTIGKPDEGVVRFQDIPFQKETRLLNKTITCGPNHWGHFSAVTYTCDNIKVDGLRLAYGYYPGWGVDETCQDTGGKQELAQLCRMLLQATDNSHLAFYGVFVNNATCGLTTEKRYMLSKHGINSYQWTLMDPGNGWLSSISCLLRS